MRLKSERRAVLERRIHDARLMVAGGILTQSRHAEWHPLPQPPAKLSYDPKVVKFPELAVLPSAG